MAHELMATDGLVLAGKSAWHGLGTVVEDAPSIQGALRLAGLDWRVEQTAGVYGIVETAAGPVRLAADSHVLNVRSDTHEVLGVVGAGYTPMQNAELADFAEALMSQGARVESAGSIRGGKRVWFLVRTDRVVELGADGADQVVPYVLLANGHDGSLAFWVQPTSVRVVCSNTFHLALSDRKEQAKVGRALRLRHTSGIMGRVDEAARVLEAWGLVVKGWEERARALAGVHLTRGQLRDYFAGVYKAAFAEPDSDRGRSRRQNVLDRWYANMDDRRQNIAGIRGTPWAAFNAVSQWSDHEQGPDQTRDERTYRNMFGSGTDLKAAAWDAALALV